MNLIHAQTHPVKVTKEVQGEGTLESSLREAPPTQHVRSTSVRHEHTTACNICIHGKSPTGRIGGCSCYGGCEPAERTHLPAAMAEHCTITTDFGGGRVPFMLRGLLACSFPHACLTARQAATRMGDMVVRLCR
jgi:hypothetical protein